MAAQWLAQLQKQSNRALSSRRLDLFSDLNLVQARFREVCSESSFHPPLREATRAHKTSGNRADFGAN